MLIFLLHFRSQNLRCGSEFTRTCVGLWDRRDEGFSPVALKLVVPDLHLRERAVSVK